MLNITNHQGNRNLNYSERLLHTHQNGYYQKITSVNKDVEKMEPLCINGGDIKGVVAMENNMTAP